MIIRDLWVKKSKSVRSHPILVLSYKNLAIDSFLVDLVTSEPSSLSRQRLIRIGGQCKEPKLAQFSETNAFQTDSELQAVRGNVDSLNHLKDSIDVSLHGALSSFYSYQYAMGENTDEQKRMKTLIEATTVLMECIIRNHLLLSATKELEVSCIPKPDVVLKELSFLLLGLNQVPSAEVKKYVESQDGSSFVTLSQGIAHYGPMHWGDMMLMWLSGKIPLRMCGFIAADGNQCSNLSSWDDIGLCEEHRCIFGSKDNKRCIRPCRRDGAMACAGHSCLERNCYLPKMSDMQHYCDKHVCRRCMELGIVSKVAIGRPPSNVCDDHPLCLVPTCVKFCAPDGIYCENHNVVVCLALTKKKLPCKGTPISRNLPYCANHKHLFKPIIQHKKNDSDDDISIESEVSVIRYDASSVKCIRFCQCSRSPKTTRSSMSGSLKSNG